MEETFIPAWLHPNIQQILSIYDEAAWNEFNRSKETLRPCIILNAGIMRQELCDGTHIWVAYYPIDRSLVIGVEAEGKTPEEAFANFDKAWKGES